MERRHIQVVQDTVLHTEHQPETIADILQQLSKQVLGEHVLILLVIMVVIMHTHPVQQPDIVILQVLTADILQKQSINHREVQVVQLQPVIPVELPHILLVQLQGIVLQLETIADIV